MRILYTNFHAGDGGGHTTYVMSLVRQLADRHALHVLAPPNSRLLIEAQALPGVSCQAHGFARGATDLASIGRLRHYLRSARIELVHVNGAHDHSQAMLARLGLHPRPSIVYSKHNSKPSGSLGNRLRARFGTDAVIAVSAHTREYLRQSPYAHCPISVIRNGIDLAHYVPMPADTVRSARQAITTDDGDLVLGSCAGTADYKGWQDLVEALALLPANQRNRVHLMMAGKSPPARALERIRALGLQHQVHFPGLLSDVRPLLAGIDAGFVLSWAVETTSFACREMMAMGKPVWVSDYAGLQENIRPDVDGWVTPARDLGAMVRQLQSMLAQRTSLAAMGRAAREHAEAEFSLGRAAADTERLYQDTVDSRL